MVVSLVIKNQSPQYFAAHRSFPIQADPSPTSYRYSSHTPCSRYLLSSQICLHLARPCTANSAFLKEPIPKPEPAQPLDATPENLWAPFPDRLACDWDQYHFVCLQSSEDEIHEGLDLWHATVIKHKSEHPTTDHVPWKNAHDLYEMLDSIKAGAVGWKTYNFCYTGSKPQTPPQWMEETYKLNI